MKHIEFIGLGGSGKTTLFNEIVNRNGYYGGLYDNALLRVGPDSLQVILEKAPQIVRSKIEMAIWSQYKQKFNRDFEEKNQQYKQIIQLATTEVTNEREEIFELMKSTCNKYELGVQTVSPNEVFVMDEGFCHRAVSIAVRTNEMDISVNQYLNLVPVPEIVVHVDPSNKVINKRKHKRDGETYRPEYLQKRKHFNSLLVKNIRELGSDIIRIENEQNIDKEVQKLVRKIDQHC